MAQVAALDPFALLSLFIGDSREIQMYARSAEVQTDDRLRLEFSAPIAFFDKAGQENTATLLALRDRYPAPAIVRTAISSATPAQWRNRGMMMFAAGAPQAAYEDFARALAADPADIASLALADAAIVTNREASAAMLLQRAIERHHENPSGWVATSRLFAAGGRFEEALHAAEMAARVGPAMPAGLEQQAALYAEVGDGSMLAAVAGDLARAFPNHPGSTYYAAAAEFFAGRFDSALAIVSRTTTLHPSHADAHNLRGAVLARLGRKTEARAAFENALRIDPRDDAAYRNAGLLELDAGNREAAAEFFADALALDPTSEASREGLARALLTAL